MALRIFATTPKVFEILDKITILDPACDSGAFLDLRQIYLAVSIFCVNRTFQNSHRSVPIIL
jgi:hypothetical protein